MSTEALVLLGELDPEAIGPALEFATHYEPTPLGDFDRFMKALPPDFNIRAATFVDAGCGMGRVVLLAAGHPFAQVIGIEVSPALYEIAKENLALYPRAPRQCRDVRLICADAARRPLPAGDLLIYLYNPFDARLMRAFACAVEERNDSGTVLVAYHTPAEPNAFEETGAFSVVRTFDFGALYRLT